MSLRYLFLAVFSISALAITHQIKTQDSAPAIYAWDYQNDAVMLNEKEVHNCIKNIWDRFANRPQCYSIEESIFNTNTNLGATLDSENVITIWKMTQNEPTQKEFLLLQTIEDQEPRHLSFSPSGTIFAYHTQNADHTSDVLKLAMRNGSDKFEVFQALEGDTTALCIGGYSNITFDASETIMAAYHILPSEDPALPDIHSIRIFARQQDNSFKLIQEIHVELELYSWISTFTLSLDGSLLAYSFHNDSDVILLMRTADNNFEFYKKTTCETGALPALLNQSK